MNRQASGLRSPQPGQAEKVKVTPIDRPIFRAVDAHHPQPWWFSTRTGNDDPGRFDLEAPYGACYWAVTTITAIVEKVSDPGQLDPPIITPDALGELNVWRVVDGRSVGGDLADFTKLSVRGMTREISSTPYFDIPHLWADAVHQLGRNGILYEARFGFDEAVALFGDAGVPPDAPDADLRPALDFWSDLPADFRSRVSDAGDFDTLPRAAEP